MKRLAFFKLSTVIVAVCGALAQARAEAIPPNESGFKPAPENDEHRLGRHFMVNLSNEITPGDSSSESRQILVEVEYWQEVHVQNQPGHSSRIKFKRKLWMGGEFSVPNLGSHDVVASDVSFHFSPIVEGNMGTEKGGWDTERSISRFPTRIYRKINDGTRVSATISVLGYNVSAEHELGSSRLKAFAEVGANVLGLRFLSQRSRPDKAGLEFARIAPEFGVEWQLDRNFTIKLSPLGFEVGETGLGPSFRGAHMGTDTDVFSRLEAAYRETVAFFIEVGQEHFLGEERSDRIEFGFNFRF